MKNNNNKAFSLIELLVALSILAVVAAIIVPKFLNMRKSAADTVATAQLKTIDSIYQHWVGLGGNPGAAPAGQVLYFLSRPGTNASATRNIAGAVPRDTVTTMGSYMVQISGIAVDNVTTTVDTGDSDGLYTAATGGPVIKIGNWGYTLSCNAGVWSMSAGAALAAPGGGGPIAITNT